MTKKYKDIQRNKDQRVEERVKEFRLGNTKFKPDMSIIMENERVIADFFRRRRIENADNIQGKQNHR